MYYFVNLTAQLTFMRIMYHTSTSSNGARLNLDVALLSFTQISEPPSLSRETERRKVFVKYCPSEDIYLICVFMAHRYFFTYHYLGSIIQKELKNYLRSSSSFWEELDPDHVSSHWFPLDDIRQIPRAQ